MDCRCAVFVVSLPTNACRQRAVLPHQTVSPIHICLEGLLCVHGNLAGQKHVPITIKGVLLVGDTITLFPRKRNGFWWEVERWLGSSRKGNF